MMAITANAQTLNLGIYDMLENEDDFEWGYQLYDGDISIAEGTYVQITMGSNTTQTMQIWMNGEVVYTKPASNLKYQVIYSFTAGKNCKILGGYQNMFNWNSKPNIYFTPDASVAVTGVTLSQTTSSLTAGGAALELTPTVAPGDATDKTVKWSVVQEGSIVALYTDEACTQAVGTDAIDPAKVYMKPLAAGQATVTVASNVDASLKATCTVTVAAAEPTYNVTFKEGTENVGNWTIDPASAKQGQPVTVKYNGTKKVKSVKAVKKAAEPAYTMAAAATDADKGKLICADGHIHANGEDAECTAARVAKIIYIGTTGHATYTHGLALALTDEGTMAWEDAKTACNTTKNTNTPVTDATWLLASKDQLLTNVFPYSCIPVFQESKIVL